EQRRAYRTRCARRHRGLGYPWRSDDDPWQRPTLNCARRRAARCRTINHTQQRSTTMYPDDSGGYSFAPACLPGELADAAALCDELRMLVRSGRMRDCWDRSPEDAFALIGIGVA